ARSASEPCHEVLKILVWGTIYFPFYSNCPSGYRKILTSLLAHMIPRSVFACQVIARAISVSIRGFKNHESSRLRRAQTRRELFQHLSAAGVEKVLFLLFFYLTKLMAKFAPSHELAILFMNV